ncbi:MAG: DNA-binding protein [Elusimicrobia bacterium CG08_land_8_20_14_0_20_51_18]|nr:MAG: DNA-binding protein [Elusimicrobia bacterium CG08_land_8_20_14_0_20_51_18]
MPAEVIESKIFIIRGKKVMLDYDLARLYGVETRYLKRAVRRNLERFPIDFMLRISKKEATRLSRCQIGTLKRGENLKYFPYAFTENGIAMLSSVLNSSQAIKINIQIMRTFTRLRDFLNSHKELASKLEELEKKYDAQFKIVFEAIREILTPPDKPVKRIGFTAKEKRAAYRL